MKCSIFLFEAVVSGHLTVTEQPMIQIRCRGMAIFNTDQGSQFSSSEWTGELKKNGIQISMEGKDRWMDNVFIERLWRSIKYEKLRLWSYNPVGYLSKLVADWKQFHKRKHQSLNYATPWSLYSPPKQMAA